MNRKRICIYFYAILCSFRIKILIFNVIFLLFFLFWLKRFGKIGLCIRKYCDNNNIACNMNNFEANLRLSRTDFEEVFLVFFLQFSGIKTFKRINDHAMYSFVLFVCRFCCCCCCCMQFSSLMSLLLYQYRL